MLQNTSHSPSPSKAEYVVYAYNFVKPLEQERWTRIMSSDDVNHVTSRAQDLFQSEQYKRIEIQKKFFDPRQNKRKAHTVKTFEKKASDNYLMLLTVLLMGFTSVGFFYLYMM